MDHEHDGQQKRECNNAGKWEERQPAPDGHIEQADQSIEKELTP